MSCKDVGLKKSRLERQDPKQDKIRHKTKQDKAQDTKQDKTIQKTRHDKRQC